MGVMVLPPLCLQSCSLCLGDIVISETLSSPPSPSTPTNETQTAHTIYVQPVSPLFLRELQRRGEKYTTSLFPLACSRALLQRSVVEGDQYTIPLDSSSQNILISQCISNNNNNNNNNNNKIFFVDYNTRFILRLSSPSSPSPSPSPSPPSPSPSSAPSPPPSTLPSSSSSQIGGMREQLKEMRETVFMALKNPQLFYQFGVNPPKGILLCGPPGTGKTLMARIVAEEICNEEPQSQQSQQSQQPQQQQQQTQQQKLFVLNAPEIVSKFQGESEENLARVFQSAINNQPSVIFIDEIDAIAPKNENSGNNSLEKRVVGALSSLIDSLTGHRVVVIAATNRPNSLDDSIRRAGRFDVEIQVPIPAPSDRLSILSVMMSKIPNNITDDQLKEVGDSTHGYVGADLDALCKESCLLAFSRLVEFKKKEQQQQQEQQQDNLGVVTYSDLRQAMSRICPSAMREVMVEVPTVKWTDIGGNDHVIQSLKEAVSWPFQHPEAFERMGIRPPRGLLLYGPPGCSKTMMAKALATEAGLNFLAVKGPELFSKWVGESEKAVREVFRKGRAASPSIIFFDEIDGLAVKRGSTEQGTSVSDRVLSQLLSEMDGVSPLEQVIVVAATNRPDMLDDALLRPGRLDRKLYVPAPDAKGRQEILKIQLKKIPHSEVNVDKLVELTEGCSGAEVVNVCREASLAALRRDIQSLKVEEEDFISAASKAQRRITPEMLAFYSSFAGK